MSKIVTSSKFKRAFRKFARRNTQLQARIEEAIADLSDDIFDPSLGTHKLEGKLTKQFIIAGKRNAGEIDFKEFSVAIAVGRRMKDSVDVVKDGFWSGKITEKGV
jgi:hypothetical protein